MKVRHLKRRSLPARRKPLTSYVVKLRRSSPIHKKWSRFKYPVERRPVKKRIMRPPFSVTDRGRWSTEHIRVRSRPGSRYI